MGLVGSLSAALPFQQAKRGAHHATPASVATQVGDSSGLLTSSVGLPHTFMPNFALGVADFTTGVAHTKALHPHKMRLVAFRNSVHAA